MLKRPKSAVLLSLPYNFQTKQEAVDIKQKVKKSLLTFDTDESLEMDLYQQKRKFSCRSYIDNGPSILNSSTNHYSVSEQGKTHRTLQQSRAKSAVGFTKKSAKENVSPSTGLENYQRLKPCKTINLKTIQNLEDCLNNARKESKFMERVFENISPRKDLIKKGGYEIKKRFRSKEKENKLQIKGNNLTMFQQPSIDGKVFFQDTPFKTNVFQPTLQRRGLQLLRKSKAYLMAR